MFSSPSFQYAASEAVSFTLLAIMALGLNISFGMAGIVDFGYIVFVALGAYIGGVSILGPADAGQQLNYILGLSLPWPVALLLGALAAAALGLLVGLVALRRLRSDYQAIVMIAIWSIAIDIVGNTNGLFNGQSGLYNVSQPFASNVDPRMYVWIFLPISAGFLVCLATVALLIERSAFGRTLRALRDDPDLATALGKANLRLRLKAMMLGAFYAGIAGALFIQYLGAWNTSGWSIFEVVAILAAIIMGGRGRVTGVIIGSLIVTLLFTSVDLTPTIADRPFITADLRQVVLGGLFVAILLFRPRGVLRERIGTKARGNKARGSKSAGNVAAQNA